MTDKTKRHLVVLILSTILIVSLEYIRDLEGWELKMHTWNKAFGDVSIFYIMITLLIGSLSKINKHFSKFLPWARPIGIWSMIFALVHIVIVIGGWDDWNIWWLVGFSTVRDGTVQFTMPGFGFANIVGLIAVIYGLAVLATSNDSSITKLGFSSWKYLQQRCTHMLYILATLHTIYFLYYFYYSYNRELPPPNFLRNVFLIPVLLLFMTHCVSFFKVYKGK